MTTETQVQTVQDIALHAGVAPATIYAWRDRYADFPKPVRVAARKRGGAGYDAGEIERFLRTHKLGIRYESERPRRGGRPRSRYNLAIEQAYLRGRADAETTVVHSGHSGLSPWWLPVAAGLGTLTGIVACTLLG